MNNVRAKGLDELRTVTTHHIASKPPRKGTSYLDLFVLSMERQRLEQELTGIERRRKRIFTRLGEVQTSMEKLVSEAQKDKIDRAEPGESSRPKSQAAEQKWKRMTVNY